MKNIFHFLQRCLLLLLLVTGLQTQAQNQPSVTVKGTVTDEAGKPLEAATIEVKGTTNRTLTKADGTFTITAPSGSKLVITSVGYFSQEVNAQGNSPLNVTLQVFVNSMDEVVVVGYGTQKRATVTSSISSINADEIRSRPVANALEAMQGKVAGADITSNDRPGQTGSITIRGVRSIKAGNSPLYVVDGIPLNFGGIDAINPNDIESVDVLKDASATAVYGSRGANGVILVTTKKGKTGVTNLNYYGSLRLDKLVDRTEMMNSDKYIEFRRNAYRRASYIAAWQGAQPPSPQSTYPSQPTQADDNRIFNGASDSYGWANILKGWAGGTWNGNLVPTTDWEDMVLRTGLTQDHNISVSGGTQKVKAYASFGYLNQKGVMLGQDFTRYTGKVSVDITPLKWFRMGANLNFTYSLQNYGYETTNTTGSHTIYAAAQSMLPYTVPFDSLGNRINMPGADVNILNPIGEDKYTTNLRKRLRALGSVYAEVTLYKGLKYRLNFGPDLSTYYNGIFMDSMSINRGGGVPGSTNRAQLNQTNYSSWTLDNLIYYDKNIAGKHDIGITLLQEALYNRSEASSMTATKLPWNSQKWYALQNVSSLDGYSTGLSENSLTSYMARVNYGYDNKYMLTAYVRWDGASVLAQGHKWDMFPSASVAWRIDREKFMKDVTWVDNLKLRFGVASVGNAAVDPYTTLGGLQSIYYTYGATVLQGFVASDPSSASPATFPDQNLGWEHTTQWNLGIDFGLFKNRLSGTVDIYTTSTTGLLLNRSIPSVNGYTYTLTNIGATAGKGIDVTLNSANIKTHNFSWNTNITFSATKDKITKLAVGDGKQDDINDKWFIGKRINVYYDYKKTGIWQEADKAEIAQYTKNTFIPGQIKVLDKNGDHVIDANDMQIVGHAQPNWTGGMTNDFSYKNWGLSVFIYARWGFTYQTGNEYLQGRYAQRQLNYWAPANPTNDYPAPNYASAAGDVYVSSMNYYNGSFIRIRNITLSYNLPATTAKKIQLSNLKVYAQVINPTFIYSGVKFIDPDTGTSTFNRGFVLGVNATF